MSRAYTPPAWSPAPPLPEWTPALRPVPLRPRQTGAPIPVPCGCCSEPPLRCTACAGPTNRVYIALEWSPPAVCEAADNFTYLGFKSAACARAYQVHGDAALGITCICHSAAGALPWQHPLRRQSQIQGSLRWTAGCPLQEAADRRCRRAIARQGHGRCTGATSRAAPRREPSPAPAPASWQRKLTGLGLG